jgi:hypothetical protein
VTIETNTRLINSLNRANASWAGFLEWAATVDDSDRRLFGYIEAVGDEAAYCFLGHRMPIRKRVVIDTSTRTWLEVTLHAPDPKDANLPAPPPLATWYLGDERIFYSEPMAVRERIVFGALKANEATDVLDFLSDIVVRSAIFKPTVAAV